MKGIKFSLAHKDEYMAELVKKTGHKTLAVWAIDCVERVLPYFEEKYPEDRRPRQAVETLQIWINTGVFKMAVIRKAALSSHAAAREVGKDNASPFDEKFRLAQPFIGMNDKRSLVSFWIYVYNMLDLYTQETEMRTNVVIDDQLIKDALEISGFRTKKAAIEAGLKLLVKFSHQAKVKNFRGKLEWSGDLDKMRTDK